MRYLEYGSYIHISNYQIHLYYVAYIHDQIQMFYVAYIYRYIYIYTYKYVYIYIRIKTINLLYYINNVGITIINHPPVITIDSWYVCHSQSWVVYGIVTPTLRLYYCCYTQIIIIIILKILYWYYIHQSKPLKMCIYIYILLI